MPESHVHVAKRIQHCHWTQGLEGDIDSSHLGFLHGHAISLPVNSNPAANLRLGQGAPEFSVRLTPGGLVQATRRVTGDGQDYWRVGQWFYPGFTTIPPRGGDQPLQGHSWTPIDNGNSLVFTFTWHPARPLSEEELARIGEGTNFHAHLAPGSFEPRANKANEYVAPGFENEKQPWMRIKYFQDQDICMTESMGPLYDRTQENLGNSDLVVTRTRGRLVEAARDLARGKEPPAVAQATIACARSRSYCRKRRRPGSTRSAKRWTHGRGRIARACSPRTSAVVLYALATGPACRSPYARRTGPAKSRSAWRR